MIDIAWSEFLFISLIALILIGPKELPSALRHIGRWVGKVRAFTKEISAQLDLEKDTLSTPSQEKTPPASNESASGTKPGPFGETKP